MVHVGVVPYALDEFVIGHGYGLLRVVHVGILP